MSVVRVGTRGSALALSQAREVVAMLKASAPDVHFEIVEVVTTGDRLVDQRLGPSLGNSFFTKEIEQALLRGRIDLAVHSCKDLATAMHPGLALVAVPPREDPRDVLVSGGPTLAELPAGARVGTSSPRRAAFVRRLRPDLVITHQRGNVPTRVRAVEDGLLDASVVAFAGLRRLGLQDRIAEVFEVGAMLPAAGQGALAVQARVGDARAAALARPADDPASRAEITAERACLRRMGAGCHAPVGALARHDAGVLALEASFIDERGLHTSRGTGAAAGSSRLGEEVGTALLARLGLETLGGSPPERAAAPVAWQASHV
jgi:hydroxymethylbilane synthase